MHSHTVLSDGRLEPAALVRLAASEVIRTLAVTDHDTTEGVAAAQEEGRRSGVRVIPGVELSARDGRSIHVLGLFVDPAAAWLEGYRARQTRRRRERVAEICDKLRSLGVELDAQAVIESAGEGTAGRPHVAMAMVRSGQARDVDDAFERYLGTGRPAFVAVDTLTVPEAIEGVRASGGVPVLAHPGIYGLDDRIPAWVDAGLAGVECAHPEHDSGRERRYRRLCADLGVLVSGGSDFHGYGSSRNLPPGSRGISEDELAALEAQAGRG